MAEQQLFCDPDDRHRAVLLAGCLKDMGQPTRLVDSPEAPAPQALLLWTNRASRSPWLSALLSDHRDLVVLAIDAAPLPSDCTHVLALSTWPARSADRSLVELVGWLKDTSRPGPFARRAEAAPEPGGGSALVVLGLLALVVGAAVIGSGSDDGPGSNEPETYGVSERAVLRAGNGVAGGSRSNGADVSGAGAADRGAGRASPASLPRAPGAENGVPAGSGSVSPVAAAGGARSAIAEDLSARRDSAGEARATPTAELTARGSPVGGSSLDHLCRAESLAAARAWSRVLTPRQRREALTLPCVRTLLGKPGYEPLREEIQA